MNSYYTNDYLSEIHKLKNYIPWVPIMFCVIHISVSDPPPFFVSFPFWYLLLSVNSDVVLDNNNAFSL